MDAVPQRLIAFTEENGHYCNSVETRDKQGFSGSKEKVTWHG
jgi:hypothetical protein